MFNLYDVEESTRYPLKDVKDDYKIEKKINEVDTLTFEYPKSGIYFDKIKEEDYIDLEDGTEYVVKEINYADENYMEYVCQLNVEYLKGATVEHFKTYTDCKSAMNLALAGTGWSIGDYDSVPSYSRNVEKNYCSAYDVIKEIQDIYKVEMTFDYVNMKVNIYNRMGNLRGKYFIKDLNLKQLKNQNSSYDFATRMIPIGKNGLTVAGVNGGKDYIENHDYSQKNFTIYWEDNRYTDPNDLLYDATIRLAELAYPQESYSADVYDLARVSNEYSVLDYDLGDWIHLIDKNAKIYDEQRIIDIVVYPNYPEKNTIELANSQVNLEDLQIKLIEAMNKVNKATTTGDNIDDSKITNVDWSKVTNVSIKTADINDAAIVTAKIGDLAVTEAKITDGAITRAKIDTAIVSQLDANTATINNLSSNYAHITNGVIDNATISYANVTDLSANYAHITDGIVDNATIDVAKVNNLNANYAHILNGIIDNAKIDVANVNNLSANYAHITDGVIDNATIDIAKVNNLSATYATITNLNAATGRITNLESTTASINTLLAGNLSATNMQAGFITADCGLIANGAIASAQIISLDVSKINAGTISTSKFTIQSDSGYLSMSDNTIQIKDSNRVRVQIGKDASNDYNMYVWDASGNLMFDATGLKAYGIKDKIIRDDMVSDTANINAAKLDIDSLFSEMNGSANTLNSSKIYLDTQAQTLDVAFNSLSNTVTNQENTITSQGTSISTIQGQISSKIWQTDIATASDNLQGQIDTINTNYSTLNQTVNGISTDVASLQTTTSDLGSRMSTAESNITQNANDISLKASQADLNTTNSNVTTAQNTANSASNAASAAQIAANNAQSTANSKRRVFASQPTPPYDVGDLWISTSSSGDNMVCTTARASGSYTASDWSKDSVTQRMASAETKITTDAIVSTVTSSTTYTDAMSGKVSTNEVISCINQTAESIKIDASKIDLSGYVTISSLGTEGATTINGSNITTGSISAARIAAGTLTGFTIQTASSGERIVLNSSLLSVYYSTGYLGMTVNGGGLSLYSPKSSGTLMGTIWSPGIDSTGIEIDSPCGIMLNPGSGYSVFINGELYINGGANLDNTNINNVNQISFNDPGYDEGLHWNGGNDWIICECPDDASNAAGNLQFYQDSTRRATIDTSGLLDVPGNIQSENTIYAQRFAGYTTGSVTADNLRIGSASSNNCRFDTGSGTFRIFTSALGSADYGIVINTSGEVDFKCNSATNAYITGAGAIHGTSKSAITNTVDYGTVITYSDESPDHVFNDRGRGQLDSNGECIVTLDPIFTETVNTQNGNYIVLLTGIKTSNVYVDDLQAGYFIAKGEPGKEFFWTITAERYGYEGLRWNDADLDI